MFDLTFEINGRKVDSNNMKDAIEKATFKLLKENITKNVGSIKCPQHHSSAKIIAKGNNIHNVSFSISGCCQKLIDETTKKLKSIYG